MELFKNTRVVFDEGPHTYLLDGATPLIGVTSLMKKHGLSPDYSGIDDETLARAASLGSMAHQTLENYCNGLPTIETPLIKSFKKLNVKAVATEYLVSDNETVASSIDFVMDAGENKVELWDAKRTSTVHRDALAWQLGIYKYLFELYNPTIEVVACKCLPIKKGNRDDIEKDTCGTPVLIEPVSAKEVKALIACESMGMPYRREPQPDDSEELVCLFGQGELDAVGEASKKLLEAQAIVKELEATVSCFKERAYQYMLEKNKDIMRVGTMEIKLKRPYNRESLDTKTLKAEHPEIAEQYTKVAETKGNVSINIL